jgi:putative transposase
MVTNIAQMKLPFVDEERLGGLSELERQNVYERAGYGLPEIRQLEWMIAESGLRAVGKGALNNIRVHLASRKNRAARILESHTCERVFAYELELDQDVLGYYVQVPCRGVVRITNNGLPHVSNATLDFLVFRHDGVELVECKTRDWLQKHDGDGNWVKVNGRWTCHAYEQWARERGIPFIVWAPPSPVASYLRTLEAMYAVKGANLTAEELSIAERSIALLAIRPYTVEELGQALPGFRERIALALLADQRCYGLLKSTPIAQGQHFYLYSEKEQARRADALALQAVVEATSQLVALDAIARASTTDYRVGTRRLARVERIAQGLEKPTVRMAQLAKKVQVALSKGRSALTVCLTSYGKSGNRETRLNPIQQQCLEWVIRVLWNRGKVRTLKGLWFELEKECTRYNVETPGQDTLRRHVRREDKTKRALATGGMRAYQKEKPVSDPVCRSGTAIGFGLVLHVDSSQFDDRCAPIVELAFPAEKPWFYIGTDEATTTPMAHALIFGRARTEGLAILIREFVDRHGFLPSVIVLDRGSENDSEWLRIFCLETGITLLYAPTGGSRYNSQAECCIRQINVSVAHELPGSTEPDMKGRSVDGKFKSRKTARLAFMTIVSAFEKYVYGDLPNTPGGDGLTPMERRDEAIEKYGVMGVPQKLDDSFLIKTSVPVKLKGKATEKRGVRLERGIFTSESLRLMLRTSKPEEARQDCVDPSVLYVKVRATWVKAFHSDILTTTSMSAKERLFELLWGPHARRHKRKLKLDIDRVRHHRNQAHAAMPAHANVAPPVKSDDEVDKVVNSTSVEGELLPVCWDDMPVLPEE